MRHYIGIHGKYEAGKDTVADILVQHRDFVKVTFAEPLYEIIYVLNPIITNDGKRVQDIVDEIGWREAKNRYPEIRRLLQYMGHEARDVISSGIWVENWWRRASKAGQRVVAPDVRYVLDARKIVAARGQIWKVTRPDHVQHNPSLANHAGEQGIPDEFIAEHLDNREGQQEALKAQVLAAADRIPSW